MSESGGQERIAAEAGTRFRLPIYEGPLDLLLHLIKNAELDPQDVATSVITEQYLAYVEMLGEFNLDIAGEYLVMAATLLLIKSFALLPHPGAGDEAEVEELKRDLVERLLEYQRYREAADKLGERAILGRDVFAAPGEPIAPESEDVPPRFTVSIFDLIEAMGVVMKRLADKAPRDIRLRDIPVAHCIPRIIEAVERRGRIEFMTLFDDIHERPLLVATFIALLELIRRRAVLAYQEVRFGPIWIERGPSEVGELPG